MIIAKSREAEEVAPSREALNAARIAAETAKKRNDGIMELVKEASRTDRAELRKQVTNLVSEGNAWHRHKSGELHTVSTLLTVFKRSRTRLPVLADHDRSVTDYLRQNPDLRHMYPSGEDPERYLITEAARSRRVIEETLAARFVRPPSPKLPTVAVDRIPPLPTAVRRVTGAETDGRARGEAGTGTAPGPQAERGSTQSATAVSRARDQNVDRLDGRARTEGAPAVVDGNTPVGERRGRNAELLLGIRQAESLRRESSGRTRFGADPRPVPRPPDRLSIWRAASGQPASASPMDATAATAGGQGGHERPPAYSASSFPAASSSAAGQVPSVSVGGPVGLASPSVAAAAQRPSPTVDGHPASPPPPYEAHPPRSAQPQARSALSHLSRHFTRSR